MKLKYIIPSLLALLTSFVSCSENDYNFPLGNIEVSTSYVSLPVGGGTTTVELNVNGDWTITKTDSKATWLEIPTPAGNADTKTITFSAESTDGGRSTEVILTCGDEKKHINVVQGITVAQNATCADVIAGPDAKTYRVTGKVQKVTEWTKYGNWYIEDETGSFQVYGTTNFKDFSIEAGDEVTVEGPKKTYNGATEIENGTIISVTKSLIKVDSVMVAGVKDAAIPAAGGDADIYITTKTGSVEAEIPAAYKEWLSLKSIKVVGDETVVTVTAAENVAAARSAELEFTTVKGGKTYKGKTSINQAGAKGTKALPFSVEEAIEFANANADGSATEVYIKGIVSKVEKEYNATKHTAVFWISSDGAFHDKDFTKDFEVYGVKGLDNKDWEEGDHQVTVGQEVLVCAKVKVYKGTPETDGGYVCYFANYGDGTAENPFDAIAAIKAVNEGSTAEVYIAGKISKVQNQFNADKGTANFWISPDGTHVDKNYATEFEGYKIKYFGNEAWVEGNKTLKEGDFVVFKGKLTKYKDTCETSEGYLISINGDNGMD
jgi:hypothetical protein